MNAAKKKGLEFAELKIAESIAVESEIVGIKSVNFTRKFDKILNGAVRIVNCRKIFFFTS